jgi:hypothetical protein
MQEMGEARILPLVIEVRDEPWDEHEVARSGAQYLIGDVDVAALGVMGLGQCHATALPIGVPR